MPEAPRPPAPTGRSLRASLLGQGGVAAPPRLAERTHPGSLRVEQFHAPRAASTTPTAAEVLAATPALVRLCESYHRARSDMVNRGRLQRLGILVLVGAISIGALMLRNSGTLTATLVSDLVLAVAGASSASVGLLGLLWLRDARRLRSVQGERFLRALQSSCSLPAERLAAFRANLEPVAAFFACYETWRADHAPGAAAGLLRALRRA